MDQQQLIRLLNIASHHVHKVMLQRIKNGETTEFARDDTGVAHGVGAAVVSSSDNSEDHMQYQYSKYGDVKAALKNATDSTTKRESLSCAHFHQNSSLDPRLIRDSDVQLVSADSQTSTQSSDISQASAESSQTDSTTTASVPTARHLETVAKGNAHNLKRKFIQDMGRTSGNRKLTGELDPENRDILRLRQEENRSFEDIAQILNDKRLGAGLQPSLSANAIYSRYKRNGPLIAAAAGQKFVPTEMDRASRTSYINFRQVEPIVGFNAREDELLVQAYQHIQSNVWKLVAEYMEHKLGGAKHDAKMCARRYDCL